MAGDGRLIDLQMRERLIAYAFWAHVIVGCLCLSMYLDSWWRPVLPYEWGIVAWAVLGLICLVIGSAMPLFGIIVLPFGTALTPDLWLYELLSPFLAFLLLSSHIALFISFVGPWEIMRTRIHAMFGIVFFVCGLELLAAAVVAILLLGYIF